MEPTTIILALFVALQAAYTAWTHLRGTEIEERTDMASLIDSRIQVELSRQDREISKLKERVAHLEQIEAEYRVAQLYMSTHGIPWPPDNHTGEV